MCFTAKIRLLLLEVLTWHLLFLLHLPQLPCALIKSAVFPLAEGQGAARASRGEEGGGGCGGGCGDDGGGRGQRAGGAAALAGGAQPPPAQALLLHPVLRGGGLEG